jgi:hypothetical protein
VRVALGHARPAARAEANLEEVLQLLLREPHGEAEGVDRLRVHRDPLDEDLLADLRQPVQARAGLPDRVGLGRGNRRVHVLGEPAQPAEVLLETGRLVLARPHQ